MNIAELSIGAATSISSDQLAGLLTRSFVGYVVPISFTPETLERIVQVDGVDLEASQILVHQRTPVGAALIARGAGASRIASMAIAPAVRARGVGGWFLNQLLARASSRGDSAVNLEVIASNVPARRLYERAGFAASRQLLGYEAFDPRGEMERLEPASLDEIASIVSSDGIADLPWQVNASTLARMGARGRSYRLGPACAVLVEGEDVVSLRCVVVPHEKRRKYWATRLMGALFAEYRGKRWSVPALCPEELPGSFFEKLGFQRGPISQIQMKLVLP